jgi:predicted O-linked N-acetylglucosamine transferase (SPINDLY family)
LILAPRVLLADHIARFRCADLFLDTFPCAAHTTASDSLWAGVPVVTLVGDTFASRVAASLLKAVDLPELIAENLEDYYEIARKISSDPSRAAALKAKLEAERETSVLFDSLAYTRDLEAAYVEAFENWRRQDLALHESAAQTPVS